MTDPAPWRVDEDGPVAVEVGPAEPEEVWICARGRVMSGSGDPPADVALSVTLASQGMDSREAMVADLERRAADVGGRLTTADRTEALAPEALALAAQANALYVGAAMLRRGTVAP
jgi:hypothetical protein